MYTYLKGTLIQHSFVLLYFSKTRSCGIAQTHLELYLDPSATGPKF